jgi:SNF2 family DNA or RNA helicase
MAGNTTQAERIDLITQFNNEDDKKIFLMSTKVLLPLLE